MKTKVTTLATLALALSSTLAFAVAPKGAVQNTGTRAHANQYHDRTPRVHERGSSMPR